MNNNAKVVLSTSTQAVNYLTVETQVSRELRVPAAKAAIMIASARTLHQVITQIFTATLADGTQVVMSTVEQESRELTEEELKELRV